MAILALDTVLFRHVGIDGDPDQREAYVRRLTDIQRVRESDAVYLLASADAWRTLEESGAAPPWSDAYESSPERDAVALALRLLDQTESIEDWLNIDDVLISDPNADPSHHIDDRSPTLADDYHRLAALLVSAEQIAESEIALGTIATLGIEEILEITISGTLEAVVPDENSIAPYRYREPVVHLGEFERLADAYNPCDLWLHQEYRSAIILNIVRTTGRPWTDWLDDDYPFILKEEFIESVTQHGFDHRRPRIRRLIRECANIIVERDLRDTRHLRTDAGPEAPQQRRSVDGAQAWRRDVDNEYRIHYWRRDSWFELAYLASHDEFTIPE